MKKNIPLQLPEGFIKYLKDYSNERLTEFTYNDLFHYLKDFDSKNNTDWENKFYWSTMFYKTSNLLQDIKQASNIREVLDLLTWAKNKYVYGNEVLIMNSNGWYHIATNQDLLEAIEAIQD